MKIAILTIGTELTRGELQDTNGHFLATELTERGYKITTMLTVDDDEQRIVVALHRLAAEHHALFITGGLGPTTDDLTTACVAKALGVSLVRDEASLERIRSRLVSHPAVSPSNQKQADFPEGATILPNDWGTAPGFSVQIADCQVFSLPGVPSEMGPMFLNQALPLLRPPERPVATARVQTHGLPEAEVNERLRGIEEEHGILIGYRASHSQIEVKVLAEAREGESQSDTQVRAEAVIAVICERLGEFAYGRGKTSLPEELAKALLARGWTLGLAESCTGGLVSEWITRRPGASLYYRGGVSCYANEVKERLLGVSHATLTTHGAVSEETARAMAEGARRVLGSDVALSFTGIAGPDGGTSEKPVGLVHWAVTTPQGTLTFQRVFRGSRDGIRKRAAITGLASLLLHLRSMNRSGDL